MPRNLFQSGMLGYLVHLRCLYLRNKYEGSNACRKVKNVLNHLSGSDVLQAGDVVRVLLEFKHSGHALAPRALAFWLARKIHLPNTMAVGR